MIYYIYALYLFSYLKCTIINGGPGAPLKYGTFYTIIMPKKNPFRVKSLFFQWCPRAPINDRSL